MRWRHMIFASGLVMWRDENFQRRIYEMGWWTYTLCLDSDSPGRTDTCYWVVSVHPLVMGVTAHMNISDFMGEEGLFSRSRVLLFSTNFFSFMLMWGISFLDQKFLSISDPIFPFFCSVREKKKKTILENKIIAFFFESKIIYYKKKKIITSIWDSLPNQFSSWITNWFLNLFVIGRETTFIYKIICIS